MMRNLVRQRSCVERPLGQDLRVWRLRNLVEVARELGHDQVGGHGGHQLHRLFSRKRLGTSRVSDVSSLACARSVHKLP
jgi:hypothetical protein